MKQTFTNVEKELQTYLEDRFKQKLDPTTKGYVVLGLLGIIYDDSEEEVEKRLDIMQRMAMSGWANRDSLIQLSEEDIMRQPAHIRPHLESQVLFALDVKREPTLEIYEKGEFANKKYIVFNDFFNEACL